MRASARQGAERGGDARTKESWAADGVICPTQAGRHDEADELVRKRGPIALAWNGPPSPRGWRPRVGRAGRRPVAWKRYRSASATSAVTAGG